MDELVARVAQAADISVEEAQRVVNLVLAFLQKEAPEQLDAVKPDLPGIEEAIAAGASDEPKGGLLSGMMSTLGGGSGVMGLAAKLSAAGLSTGEMAAAGKEIFAFARERAGDERVEAIAYAVPGLSQLL